MKHSTCVISLSAALLSLGLTVMGCQSRPNVKAAEQVAVARAAADNAGPRVDAEPPDDVFVWREADVPQGWPTPTPIGEVRVQSYPAYRAAIVRAEQLDKTNQNSMFRTLFNHIKQNDIAMTAPVEMTYAPEGDQPVAMAFLYRDDTIGQLGANGPVEVVDLPAATMVSVGVRGSYSGKVHAAAVARLQNWLEESESRYEPIGPPRFLGYNSPFVPWFMQYGEVQVPVRLREAS